MIRFGLFAAIALASAANAFCQTATLLPTRVDLSVSTIEGPARTKATFTARVFPAEQVESSDAASAAGAPTGSVSFMNGDQSIGSAFVDSEGRATYSANALPTGLQKITAVYEGDPTHQISRSTPAAVNSEASGVAAFTLSASSTSLSVVAGATATTVITATPENGFNQAVSLSCSGLPYASTTCVFVPVAVTPGPQTAAAPNGTPASSTFSIQTIASSGASLQAPPNSRQTAYAVVLPGILALAGLGLTRRRSLAKYAKAMKITGLLVLLLAGGMGLGACSQRYYYFHKPPAGNPGTPVGTYTVTVTGITGQGSGLSTGSIAITLVVKAS